MTDTTGGYFRARFTYDKRREAVWDHLVTYLSRYIPPQSAVLELGAGYCSFINRVNAARRVAIDLSKHVCDHAAAGVTAHQGDAVDVLAAWPPDM